LDEVDGAGVVVGVVVAGAVLEGVPDAAGDVVVVGA
jgi:hypothetical protein